MKDENLTLVQFLKKQLVWTIKYFMLSCIGLVLLIIFSTFANAITIDEGTTFTSETINSSLIIDESIEAELVIVNASGIYIYNSSAFVSSCTGLWLSYEAHNSIIYSSQLGLASNVSFYDQESNALLNWTPVTLELISNYYSENYSTSNGTMCIQFFGNNQYMLRYTADNYSIMHYYLDLPVIYDYSPYYDLSLYLSNETDDTNVTITIIDESGTLIEGAVVKTLRYDLDSNTYKLIESQPTNFLGEVYVMLTLNTEYYKFMIEYNGELVKTTTPTYITSSELTIPIVLSGNIADNYYNFLTFEYDLSFNTVTNNFRVDYDDTTGISGETCLYVYLTSPLSTTLYNSSCSSVASGTILIEVANITGNTYYAKLTYLDSDGEERYIDSLSYSFDLETPYGTNGLLLQALFSIVLTILSVPSGLAPVILGLSLVIGKFIGLNSIPTGISMIIVILGVILTVMLNKPRG